jgi:hypothetical protein
MKLKLSTSIISIPTGTFTAFFLRYSVLVAFLDVLHAPEYAKNTIWVNPCICLSHFS